MKIDLKYFLISGRYEFFLVSYFPLFLIFTCKIHGVQRKALGPLNGYEAKPSHSCISLGASPRDIQEFKGFASYPFQGARAFQYNFAKEDDNLTGGVKMIREVSSVRRISRREERSKSKAKSRDSSIDSEEDTEKK